MSVADRLGRDAATVEADVEEGVDGSAAAVAWAATAERAAAVAWAPWMRRRRTPRAALAHTER